MSITNFSGAKRSFSFEAYGESKTTLYSGFHLAYYPSMPQAGISPQILEGSPLLFAMVVSGQKAVWINDPELYGDVKSRSSTHCRHREKRRHSQVNAIGGWTNGAGIQPEKESQGGLLGGSLSCNGCRRWRSSGTMHGLYRHEHGTSRCGQPSIDVVFLRLQRDPGAPKEEHPNRLRDAARVDWIRLL